MGSLTNILRYPGEVHPLVKLKMAIRHTEKQFPTEPPHWAFCHSTLPKVSSSFALVIQQLGPQPQLRDSFCILYLVLRALDTVEDDMNLAAEVKLPILRNFHRHIYDRDWKFSCGTKHDKALMDGFYHVSTAFQELGISCREIIEDTTRRMGEGMAKYVCKEIETITECEEYMNYINSLYLSANLKLSHDLAGEDFSRDSLSSSLGLLHQKAHNIQGFYEDINEMPKKTLFWPRQIWSKYVDKLEDFIFEENSVKAVQCLNEMVTHALCHAEDCLKFMSNFQDPAIFRFFAIPRVMAIGTLALCYNNIQVFRRDVKMRPGLRAKVFDQIRTMSDVYGAFYDISCIIKPKVDNNDPNAAETLRILEGIQKVCKESGTLTKRDSFIFGNKAKLNNIALD